MQGKEQYSDGIDSKLFFQEVKKNKVVVVALILCCTAIATVYAFVKPVEYHSEAIVCLKSPGPTGMEENLQSIMLLKNNPELNGVELKFVKESSSIRIETNRPTAQEAHDAVHKGVNLVQHDIKVQNQSKEQEEYPSLLKAKDEMNKAREELELCKLKWPEGSPEFKKQNDEYTSRAKAYEHQLDARLRTFYDVQLLKEPSMPERPENNKRGKDILIGALLGCLISFYYCMRQYKKKG